MTAHAFISYSRLDSDFVDQLEAELNQRGVLTWRDKHNIPGGMAWYQSIVTGLDNAYAMICVVSPNADQSRWVLREQLYADERRIPCVPVLMQPHRLPFHLIETQPVDCQASLALGVAQLAAVLLPLQNSTTPITPPPAPAMFDPDRLREEYLRFLLAETKADLRDALYVELSAQTERAKSASRPRSAFETGLSMDMLFDLKQLGLEEIHGEDFDGRGVDVDDARQPINEHRKVVLLGEPGAGKTTTLLKLVVDYARTAQGDPAAPIPVFVPLREFTGATPFTAFVSEKLGILQEASDSFRLFYLLDALNEMPRKSADGRNLVAEVRDFLRDKDNWVVSCRVRDYQDDLSALSGCGKVRIKPLDLPQIHDFINRFYANAPHLPADPARAEKLWHAMKGSDALREAWEMLQAKGNGDAFWGLSHPDDLNWWDNTGRAWQAMYDDRRRILRLCRNPYMLAMVCGLFGMAGRLPDNRGALFGQFVGVLLRREEASAAEIGAAWLDAARIRAGLAQIAYAMGSQTEMARGEAERILARELPDVDAALLLRLAVAASLIDVGAEVRFTHQLLQEYFASEVLGALLDAETDPHTLWKPESWWQPNGREETLIILAGVRGDPEGVARWIAPAQPELAWQVLTDSGVAIDLANLDARTRQALIAGARAKVDEPNPVGRAAAYRVLGVLDADERPGVGVIVRDGVTLPDIDWVTIPAGEFTYQDGRMSLDYDYQIARYPVTYAQFQTFIDDPEGFHDSRWWEGLAIPDGHNNAPGDQWFKYRNHPRENVSWYDAVAFCRWLSWRLGSGYALDNIDHWAVRLPTEYEWEKAARANTGWRYPYGDDFDAAKANTRETGVGQTSAVGIFPAGDTPHWNKPVADLSGNVWEWCLTAYSEPHIRASDENIGSNTRRVLRGGAFGSSQDSARAASRSDYDPDGRNGGGGFRLVCVRAPSL